MNDLLAGDILKRQNTGREYDEWNKRKKKKEKMDAGKFTGIFYRDCWRL